MATGPVQNTTEPPENGAEREGNRPAGVAAAPGAGHLLRPGGTVHPQAGKPSERDLFRRIAQLYQSGRRNDARSIAWTLERDAETRSLGSTLRAWILEQGGYHSSVDLLLAEPDVRAQARRLIPWVVIAHDLRHDVESAIREYDALISDPVRHGDSRSRQWMTPLAVLAADGNLAAADRLARTLAEQVPLLPIAEREAVTRDLAWMQDSISRLQRANMERPTTTPFVLHYGVMGYRGMTADRTSVNAGDFIQTLAALGNLVRLPHVAIEADPSLAGVIETLRRRTNPSHQVLDIRGSIQLVPVDRDFPSSAVLATPTWMLIFGSNMHEMAPDRFDVPLPDAIRPVFISFHLASINGLTEAAVAYLRRYAPIGCRDWTTVFALLERRIPAFFSGCLSVTIDTLFGDSRQTAGTIFIDAEPGPRDDASGERATQEEDALLRRSLADNLRDGLSRLDRYRCFKRIVTSWLDGYLPLTALGSGVEFRPTNEADVRLDGLLDLDSQRLAEMQAGLRRKLDLFHRALFGGAAEDEVYDVWRAACAEDVAIAEQHFRDNPPIPALTITLPDCWIEISASDRSPAGDAVEIVMATDERMLPQLAVAMESVHANTSAHLRFHLLTRGVPKDGLAHLRTLFPETEVRAIACDGIAYGDIRSLAPHMTISSMDRLLLPDVLPSLDRVIYLDLDVVCFGDIAELWGVELGNAALAARHAPGRDWSTIHPNVYRSALRLDAQAASELRRRMHARADLTAPAINTGVLVLDLDRLRRDRFVERFLPFGARFGLHDQDIMSCYVAGTFAHLDARWNALPMQEVVRDPRIVHYAGPAKPWQDRFLEFQPEWQAYQQRVIQRLHDAAPR